MKSYEVSDLELGGTNAYDDGRLEVDEQQLRELLLEDDLIEEVRFDVAHPGESARIVHIWDIIEPRTKVEGPGTVFPGWLGPPQGFGEGVIRRLSGMSIVTCTEFESEGDEYTEQGEGIIDMSGPVAELTPFSSNHNLVITLSQAGQPTIKDFTHSITKAGLRAAEAVADAEIHGAAPENKVYNMETDVDPDLPNVAPILVVGGSSPMLDTFIYGESCIGIMPTLIHPNEMMEGSLVSSTALGASTMNKTYNYQNNPLIEDLYEAHGSEFNLVGAVVQRGYAYEFDEKDRLTSHAADLARMLDADGAIVTSEGGGHILVETMMTCKKCEEHGIKTAILMAEYCGADGTGSGFVDFEEEADLIISVGNAEEDVELPEMDVAYGGDVYIGSDRPARASDRRMLMDICGANSMLGDTRVRAQDEDLVTHAG